AFINRTLCHPVQSTVTLAASRDRLWRAETGANRVIPLRANVVGLQTELIHVLVAVRDGFLVEALVQVRRDLQACLRPCPPYIAEHEPQRPEGLALPILADIAEQPMLHRVPLRATRRVVANGQDQAEAIADAGLQVAFPRSGTAPIAPPSVRQYQQPVGSAIRNSALLLPPLCDGDDRKLGRVVRDPDIDMPLVPDQLIDAERNCSAFGRTGEIVLIDLFCLPAPDLPVIPE